MKVRREPLNDWLLGSPVSDSDLSVFRIIYASVVLLTLYRADYAAALPEVAFAPPPGPFMLLESVPPLYAIWALQAALCLSLAALVIGWRTRIAAIVSAMLQIVIYGIGYSFGKIDHTILLPVVPLLLSFSTWGSCYSVDAHLRGAERSGHTWAPRSLALALGVAMLTGGLAKVAGGWLSWDSQAVFGYALQEVDVITAPSSGTATLVPTDNPIVWEFFDYVTVVLECFIIVSVLSWRSFYLAVAILCVFHFGVLVVLGIAFPYNLLLYAAFIPWSRLRWFASAGIPERLLSALASNIFLRGLSCVLIAIAALLLAWLRPAWFIPGANVIELAIGAGVGLAYLMSRLWRARLLVTSPSRDPEVGS